ncbi:hypothetical protein P152DRAFT_484783 [Eremomyces bilateralis CBS 781.70]|uniref:Thioesterase/thiol ester dehydrase-isomerase n=1 Tax=Eremomyces bilateralis CBS 781.70 TaxID=1392243 RepID=A0A6G1FU07_9PEZI|nr:uncharacterized protein P152DRAFT_484783 [Eremomyces bilateralis CBS 781.70]KAF1809254.1 hypothetical protein P152DRAFT_484783 [Eremomyces bilateralis CBS 781.70]
MASITCTRSLRAVRCLPHPRLTRSQSTTPFASLQTSLPARPPQLIHDLASPVPSWKLHRILTGFVPPSWLPPTHSDTPIPTDPTPLPLPPAHHLVYFNPTIPENSLLPDGTDPSQSPGGPFVRRMWAGGDVTWLNRGALDLAANTPAVCVERIKDVAIKGKEGDEKVFVGIERRMGPVAGWEAEQRGDAVAGGWEQCVERRNIVFMRERATEEIEKLRAAVRNGEVVKGKVVKAAHAATISHALTPSPALLFRFSALTFNAHAIHLDPGYCREVEGHRGLLVHGPLALTLVVTMIEARMRETGGTIKSIEYRNLAPLYAGEEMRVCGRDAGNGRWDVWVEGPEGGMSLKGTVMTE